MAQNPETCITLTETPAPLPRRRLLALMLGTLAAAGCARRDAPEPPPTVTGLYPNETPELRRLIEEAAATNGVPVDLVHRVILRESSHRPAARNGPYYGLMQINPQTARTMGFRGEPSQLLDAETNLRYAVRYLRGAYLVANGNYDRSVMWYARGYYYEARDRGMLVETGLRPG